MKKHLCINTLLKSLILSSFAGILFLSCAPVSVNYFKPEGNGILLKSSSCGGPKDRIHITPKSGVHFRISAYQTEEPASLAIDIVLELQKEISFQLTSPYFQLKSPENRKAQTGKINEIVSYKTGTQYLPTDILTGSSRKRRSLLGKGIKGEFFILKTVPVEKIPEHFELIIPDFFINDKQTRIDPIRFTMKQEVFLAPFLCP